MATGAPSALSISVFVFFLPPIVAFARGHNSAFAILLLTVLLGWTGLGWVVALIWAFTGNVRREAPAQPQFVVSVNQVTAPLEAHAAIVERARADPGLAPLRAHAAARAEPRDVTPARMAIEAGREASFVAPGAPGAPLTRRVSRDGNAYYRNDDPAPLDGYLRLRGDTLYETRIAGCLHYQEALEEITGGRRDAPVYLRVNALVFPQPDNPHDPNAVAVAIGDQIVGHIPLEDATSFAAELTAIAGPGAFACAALVENGWPDWYVKINVDRPLRVR